MNSKKYQMFTVELPLNPLFCSRNLFLPPKIEPIAAMSKWKLRGSLKSSQL